MRCFVPTKAAMSTFPQPSAKTVVPSTTTTVTGSFTRLDGQSKNLCHLCTPSGEICSTTSPIHLDWSNVEDNWDGERQREREQREKEQAEREKADIEQNSMQKDLEQKPNVDPEQYYPPSPQYVPSYESKFTQALTDTLVPAPEEENKDAEQEGEVGEKQDKVEEEEEEVEDKDAETDYKTDINNTPAILRVDYV